jgi:hypothetical protein
MSSWNGSHIPVGIMGAAREIASIRKEMKRLNQIIKTLRAKEKPLKEVVYEYMAKKGVDQVLEVTLKSVKPRTKRKTIQERKRDAYAFFQKEGIDDADGFWREFQLTQKASLSLDEYQHFPQEEPELYYG